MEENKISSEQLPEEEFHEEPLSKAEPESAPEAAPASAPKAEPAPATAPAPAPKKKKKKVGLILGIIAAVIVAVIVAVILITTLSGNKDFTRRSFINELGGTSETYTGALSEYTYGSAERAAEEFVYHEIVGDSYGVSINSVTSQGTVDASSVIPAELLEGSDSVEKVEVDFTRPDDTASVSEGPQAAGRYDKGGKIIVYVIRFGNEWRYFAPMPIKGEALNKSYFTSIFESDKYQNCTLEIVKTTKAGVFGFSVANTEIKWIIKRQDNKLYFEQTISNKGFLNSSDDVTAWYLEDSDGGEVKLYEKVGNGEWTYKPGYTLGFYSGLCRVYKVSEYTPFFDQLHFAPDVFNKTDYGFEVAEDKGRDYFLDTYFWREFSRLMSNEQVYFNDDDVEVKKMYAEYFIQDGALTGVRMNTEADFKSEVEDIEMVLSYSGEYVAKITNYGSTVVNSPVD